MGNTYIYFLLKPKHPISLLDLKTWKTWGRTARYFADSNVIVHIFTCVFYTTINHGSLILLPFLCVSCRALLPKPASIVKPNVLDRCRVRPPTSALYRRSLVPWEQVDATGEGFAAARDSASQKQHDSKMACETVRFVKLAWRGESGPAQGYLQQADIWKGQGRELQRIPCNKEEEGRINRQSEHFLLLTRLL